MQTKRILTANVFDSKLSSFLKQRKVQRIKNKFKDKPFYDRTARVALWLLLLSFSCNVFSAYSEHFYLRDFIGDSITSNLLASIFTVLLIVVIELIKRSTIPQLWRYWLQYGRLDYIHLIIVLVFCSISIFSSFEGAKLIPKKITPQPNLINLDSIKSEFNTQIETVDNSIEKQEQ